MLLWTPILLEIRTNLTVTCVARHDVQTDIAETPFENMHTGRYGCCPEVWRNLQNLMLYTIFPPKQLKEGGCDNQDHQTIKFNTSTKHCILGSQMCVFHIRSYLQDYTSNHQIPPSSKAYMPRCALLTHMLARTIVLAGPSHQTTSVNRYVW